MSVRLDMQKLPQYRFSSFKRFLPQERHVTRICADDILILMLEGALYFSEEGNPIEVHRGEYFIQQHGLRQEGVLPSDGAVYYYVHFRGNYCENQDALPLRGIFHPADAHDSFRRLELLQSAEGTAVEKNAEFYHILASLKSGSCMTQQRKAVLSVITRITEDYRRPYTLAELAACGGYSVNHLICLFRRETGLTPHAYITRLRLHAALILLMNSDMPLVRLSEECGFGGYVNFYKAFVKAEGCTPEAWRKQHREMPTLLQDTGM